MVFFTSLPSAKHSRRKIRTCLALFPSVQWLHWKHADKISLSSFWPLAELGWLPILYKNYIFFFFCGIDLVSTCPRDSFNHSWDLTWILTAVLEASATLGTKQPSMVANTDFPIVDLRAEDVKGPEEAHSSSGVQHQHCDEMSPLIRLSSE